MKMPAWHGAPLELTEETKSSAQRACSLRPRSIGVTRTANQGNMKGDPKIPGIVLNTYLKQLYKFELQPPSKHSPCDCMQQSQRHSCCWKHCLKSSTKMLTRAASDSG
jgi:hypothetical protein